MFVKVDLKPLEFVEVLEGKPLTLDIKGIKVQFNLWSVKDFLKFNKEYKTIFHYIDVANTLQGDIVDKLKVKYFISLIDLIYKHTKNQFKYFDRKKYKKNLKFIFMNDIALLINTYDSILKYNSDIKKKLQALANFDIFQSSASLTIGGECLSNYIQTDTTGKKFILPRYLLN